ncbi:MAG: acyloxyacyl hydrolase [Chitinophagaceae bacterium]|nr:acyloxyacyl hydrolase [Chitinophagaceae bacterium]
MTCIFLGKYLTAQTKNINFGVNMLSGRMLKHTSKITIPTPLAQQAVELSYRKQTQGNKVWQQKFGYPEIALNLLMASNGRSELGYTFGLYPSIQFSLFKRRNTNLFGKIGGGIGYVTRFWDRIPEADTLNNIIGGRINNVSMFQLGVRYYINQHWSLQTGFDFYHASNASARQPNFGINTYGFFLGSSYHPKGYKHPFEHVQEDASLNKLRFGLRLSFAMSEDKIPNGPMYPSYHFSGFVQKFYRNKSYLTFGADASYYEKLYALFTMNGMYKNEEKQHAWRYSIYAGHEFLFGKIGFPLHLGFYLNRPIEGPRFYQKLGMNYHFYQRRSSFIKDIFVSAILKTHLVQAEQAEFGFGFFF